MTLNMEEKIIEQPKLHQSVALQPEISLDSATATRERPLKSFCVQHTDKSTVRAHGNDAMAFWDRCGCMVQERQKDQYDLASRDRGEMQWLSRAESYMRRSYWHMGYSQEAIKF